MKIALIILIALIWNCINPPVNFALIASLLVVNAVGHHLPNPPKSPNSLILWCRRVGLNY